MDELRLIARIIENAGGKVFLVGGSVRDKLLGREPKDFDCEVFGLDAKTLVQILKGFGTVDVVGMSFGVIKLTTQENDFDFSLPRTESKDGKGHRGFFPRVDPTMTIEEAQARRDFTVNAMSLELSTDRLIDHFQGQRDLENRILRATTHHFAEDALRVLRGFQFAGRFEMRVDLLTAMMCESLISEFSDLSLDRIWIEWEKWATKSVKPSMGLDFLVDTTWIQLFPELESMIGLWQDATWHPEGDVWEHVRQSVDVAIEIAEREELSKKDRLVLVFAALCHDLGKVSTSEICDDGHVRSIGHDKEGIEPTRAFLKRIGTPKWLIKKVLPLVREHMFHVHTRQPSARSIRRLSTRMGKATIQELCWLMEVDHSARAPLPKGQPQHVKRMLELAEQEQCKESAVAPILMGRHLIEMGLVPGPQFGILLRAALEAQIQGDIKTLDDALEWARMKVTPEFEMG